MSELKKEGFRIQTSGKSFLRKLTDPPLRRIDRHFNGQRRFSELKMSFEDSTLRKCFVP
jgi:hypothetical protein